MKSLLSFCLLLLSAAPLFAQAKKPVTTEDDIYRMIHFPIPDDCVLEVGGLDWLDAGKKRLAIATRHGEIWVLDNVYADPPALEGVKIAKKDEQGKTVMVDPTPEQVVRFKQMLFGLHEPLGLLTRPDGIYVAQRGELTKLKDTNGDDRIDLVETFCNQWEISGGYHEYAFGPKLDRQGNFWVTLNRPFGEGPEGSGLWRGWAVKIDQKGKMTPVCPGLRSPCGLGENADGEMFYTDNQGDWTAVCKLSHLKPGSFQGEAWALRSANHPLSNFKLPAEKNWPKSGLMWREAAKEHPQLMPPAVWFPYPEMGTSNSDILWDSTGGKFGPFAKQIFVGDQGRAIIVRCFLEKIDGEYQGACFPFRKNLQSGVLRMCWGHDGSMFVGGTNRGWGGGSKPYALDRLVWTGKMPFEVLEMQARPNGFRLVFTQPVDAATAGDVKSYAMRCWTHKYHSGYGDPPQDTHELAIKSATLAADGKTVDLVIDGLETFYIHELKLPGVRNTEGEPVLHPIGYYTLTRIPQP